MIRSVVNILKSYVWFFVAGDFGLLFSLPTIIIHFNIFSQDSKLTSHWEGSFLPLNQNLFTVWMWMVVVFKRIFSKLLYLSPGLGILLLILGSFSLMNIRWTFFKILVPPFILAIAVSGLKLYPFDGRVILYLVPLLILIIVKGAESLCEHKLSKYSKAIRLVLMALLLYYPAIISMNFVKETSGKSEMKGVLAELEKKYQPGDGVAIYKGAMTAYRYYAPKFNLPHEPDTILTAKSFGETVLHGEGIQELADFERIWAVFTHVRHDRNNNERRILLKKLSHFKDPQKEFLIKLLPGSFPGSSDNNISASLYSFGRE